MLNFLNALISGVIARDGRSHIAAIAVSSIVQAGVGPVETTGSLCGKVISLGSLDNRLINGDDGTIGVGNKTTVSIAAIVLGLSLSLPLAITISMVANATIDGGPHS